MSKRREIRRRRAIIWSLTARKSLILNGEMSEWSIEHAWKALRWNSVETYRITFSAVVSTT